MKMISGSYVDKVDKVDDVDEVNEDDGAYKVD